MLFFVIQFKGQNQSVRETDEDEWGSEPSQTKQGKLKFDLSN